MKAMILAAGYGTRFRPVTYEIPKPMVPLCNKPLIAWAVDSLLEAGIDEIIINLHHLPEQIEGFVRENYHARGEFHFSFEPEILGTGGGIRKVRDLLAGDDDFILVNGDTVQQPRYAELVAARRRTDALAALSLRHPPEGDRFTKVFFDGERITGFGEGTGEALMFSGSHVISSRIFDRLPDRDFSGITEDVYIPALRSGEQSLAGVVDDRLWFDIGTPRRYLEASRGMLQALLGGDLAAPENSILGDESLIHTAGRVTGQVLRSVIGEGARVDGDVDDSAVWPDVVVPAKSSIVSSVIAAGTNLSQIRLENALVCRAVPGTDYPPEMMRLHGLIVAPVDPDRPVVAQLS